jgi:hypothetical protein
VDKQLTKKKMFSLTMFYMDKGEIYPFLEDQIFEGWRGGGGGRKTRDK